MLFAFAAASIALAACEKSDGCNAEPTANETAQPKEEPGNPVAPDGESADYYGQLPWTDVGEISLERLPVSGKCRQIEPGRLYVIRDAVALAAIVPDAPEVDFAAFTLLAVRVVTPYGIHALESGLCMDGDGFFYRATVTMNCATVIGDELLFVLAPRIDANAGVRFELVRTE